MSAESTDRWRPTASFDTLRLRATIIDKIRAFFRERDVLEVETPLLSTATVTDPHLSSMSCRCQGPGGAGRKLYLQTSPEYAMKRLLAAGSGAIYQMGKAFRDGEAGSRHNPEFTLLEWYRPGFDHHELLDEMDDLLNKVLGTPPAERSSYAELFRRHAGIDPHDSSAGELRRVAGGLGLRELENLETEDRDDWLNLVLTHFIEPKLGRTRPSFIYDYPVSQSALARVRPGDTPVAERFEVYVRGIELANGFHELTDSAEQRQRFEADLLRRQMLGKERVPVDERPIVGSCERNAIVRRCCPRCRSSGYVSFRRRSLGRRDCFSD